MPVHNTTWTEENVALQVILAAMNLSHRTMIQFTMLIIAHQQIADAHLHT